MNEGITMKDRKPFAMFFNARALGKRLGEKAMTHI